MVILYIDPSAFENDEHIGYLSTPSEFFILKENFLKQVTDVDFSEACERGLTLEEEEIIFLEKINKSPIKYLNKQILLKIIPVSKSYEAICGFPNGYFTSDLNPFENYAVAKHLNQKFGYELFGIGASLIGFIRSGNLGESQAKELVNDLNELYNSDEGMADKMIEIVKNNNHLFIKYTEDINIAKI